MHEMKLKWHCFWQDTLDLACAGRHIADARMLDAITSPVTRNDLRKTSMMFPRRKLTCAEIHHTPTTGLRNMPAITGVPGAMDLAPPVEREV